MPKQRPKPKANPSEVDQTVEVAGGELAVKEETGFYAAYAGFANNLRTWFIAYGIGGPVLLISQDSAWEAIKASGNGSLIGYTFLAGVSVQIFAALMYKTAMWYLYVGELNPAFVKTWKHSWSDWLSENYLLEALLDVVTLGLFAIATINVMRAVAAAL